MNETKFDNVFAKGNALFTKSLRGNYSEYGERVVNSLRFWDPRRSKLASFIKKGADQIGIRKADTVLYLGAASGTTVSHVSDIASEGFVFALEYSPTSMRALYYLCSSRKNMAPILADANNPSAYKDKVAKADVIYQDISQRNQVDILLKNAKVFLKKGGFCLVAVKARSIDVVKEPSSVFKEVKKQLSEHLEIVDFRTLEPFQRDHCMILCKKLK